LQRARLSYSPRGTCPRWADTPAAPGWADPQSRQFQALVGMRGRNVIKKLALACMASSLLFCFSTVTSARSRWADTPAAQGRAEPEPDSSKHWWKEEELFVGKPISLCQVFVALPWAWPWAWMLGVCGVGEGGSLEKRRPLSFPSTWLTCGHVDLSLAQSVASLAELDTSVAGSATSAVWSAVSVAVAGRWLKRCSCCEIFSS
jgi:hypothetical protein